MTTTVMNPANPTGAMLLAAHHLREAGDFLAMAATAAEPTAQADRCARCSCSSSGETTGVDR